METHFQGGTFNGMIDMYEYREDSPTATVTPLEYFPSYIFIDNKPKWGTIEYWMNEWDETKCLKDLSSF